MGTSYKRVYNGKNGLIGIKYCKAIGINESLDANAKNMGMVEIDDRIYLTTVSKANCFLNVRTSRTNTPQQTMSTTVHMHRPIVRRAPFMSWYSEVREDATAEIMNSRASILIQGRCVAVISGLERTGLLRFSKEGMMACLDDPADRLRYHRCTWASFPLCETANS